MRIQDRFERQETEDQLIIGEMIEQFLKSDMGKLFTTMVMNLQKMELSHSRTNGNSADRSLGRIEAYDTVLSDLNGFIERKKELQRPLPPAEPETSHATEEYQHSAGGAI